VKSLKFSIGEMSGKRHDNHFAFRVHHFKQSSCQLFIGCFRIGRALVAPPVTEFLDPLEFFFGGRVEISTNGPSTTASGCRTAWICWFFAPMKKGHAFGVAFVWRLERPPEGAVGSGDGQCRDLFRVQ
jgi:hypothetical protein